MSVQDPTPAPASNFSQVICFACEKPADSSCNCTNPECVNFGKTVNLPVGFEKCLNRAVASALASRDAEIARLRALGAELRDTLKWWMPSTPPESRSPLAKKTDALLAKTAADLAGPQSEHPEKTS